MIITRKAAASAAYAMAKDRRASMIGEYIVQSGATVRAAAKEFRVSKSTVHKDVTERLQKDDPVLFEKVRRVLDKNKDERHIRGGIATREKYRARKGDVQN